MDLFDRTISFKYLQLIFILVHFKHVYSESSHTCYCVKQVLDKLRNPIHIEASNIKGEYVYFIAEQTGIVHKYEPSAAKLSTYLDIQDQVISDNRFFEERGLLGFALHPNFAENSRIFLYTIRKFHEVLYAVISEIQHQNVDKEKIILLVEQSSDKRNGGQLLFGRDGYLYVFVGDGGPPDDARNEAQNGQSFLGKVLRIDVKRSVVVNNKLQYYTVPDDNPKHVGWRPEIYAVGGRNMWRCSVDKGDSEGRIFCGDLGSQYAEELNIIVKGGNYGWNIKEGNICLKTPNCSLEDEVEPIQVFNRSDGNISAIVGGPLYRGTQFPSLYGQLLFGDFASGTLYTLEKHENNKGNNWTTHSFPQCDSSKCGCDARDIRRTHLLSLASTYNDEIFLLMTDELNPHSPRGALLSLHHPASQKAMFRKMRQLTIITFLIIYFTHLVTSDHSSDHCYCLKSELSGLRGALHMEAVVIDGEEVYLIGEQIGLIHKYNPAGTGTGLTPYINITQIIYVNPQQDADLNGLLGFTVHPNYSSNRMIYLYSVRRLNDVTYVVISEIRGTEVNGEKVLLLIEQPGDAKRGGQLLFGLDGYLYAFIGDGQSYGNISSDAQDGSNLLGKVLRLDVEKVTVADYKLQYYDIPLDNPQKSGWRPEVYATGLRNPWRCAVDKGNSNGRIFCGDLGEDTSDEISIIQSGGNYGYPLKEGMTCIGNETLCANIENEVLPIFATNRSAGPFNALIGGPVYRGTQFTYLQQQMLLGDYVSGQIYTLEETIAADNSSQWMLHNFTECSATQCGCNYRSTRLDHLLSFGTTFSNELMLLMTNSLKPGDPNTVLLSLAKPESATPTCGGTNLTLNTTLALVLVLISLLAYKRD